MAYFKRAIDIVPEVLISFGQVTTSTLQQFSCINGEIAGWQISQLGLGPDGEPLYISQIYDCSSGTPVLKGSTSVLPGIDLTGGYFSTGCFPSGNPLTAGTLFVKVDYII